jgi:hypothetical protein
MALGLRQTTLSFSEISKNVGAVPDDLLRPFPGIK